MKLQDLSRVHVFMTLFLTQLLHVGHSADDEDEDDAC